MHSLGEELQGNVLIRQQYSNHYHEWLSSLPNFPLPITHKARLSESHVYNTIPISSMYLELSSRMAEMTLTQKTGHAQADNCAA